jgi:hypothetical protein
MDLSCTIIQNDERVISMPESLYSEMISFAEKQDDSNEMITIIKGNEYGDIYIVDFVAEPHNYGVFIAFGGDLKQIYLTTGISATQYLIELKYKGAISQIRTTGTLFLYAVAVSDYIDADIVYPDIDMIRTRVEQDLE